MSPFSDDFRAGRRGGRDGFIGCRLSAFAGRCGIGGLSGETREAEGALTLRSTEGLRGFGLSVFVGRGGKSTSPHAGALTLPKDSLDLDLDSDLPLTADSSDPVEAMESRLSGSVGGVLFVGCLFGNGGGGFLTRGGGGRCGS